MNEMRKLMEAIERIDEGWDPKAIADAIWLEYGGDTKSLFRLKVDQSPDRFRAMVLNFGSMTGLYNPKTLDGSEIYDAIIAELKRSDVSYDPQPGDDEPLLDGAIEEEIKSGIPGGRPFIDLTGPDGNAFVIMGRAKDYAKQLGLDGEAIVAEMQESDYENLLSVFDKYFGEYVDLYRGDSEFEESVEMVGEAYDEEVSGEVSFRDCTDMVKSMLQDMQKLERNTSRVYREATQSKNRIDFANMLLNELGETLTEITNLVEKYEDAYVSTPGRHND